MSEISFQCGPMALFLLAILGVMQLGIIILAFQEGRMYQFIKNKLAEVFRNDKKQK